MRITDIDGQRYILTATELREHKAWLADFYVVLASIPKGYGRIRQSGFIHRDGERKRHTPGYWIFNLKTRCIGCRNFDEKNFAHIVRAIEKAKIKKGAR